MIRTKIKFLIFSRCHARIKFDTKRNIALLMKDHNHDLKTAVDASRKYFLKIFKKVFRRQRLGTLKFRTFLIINLDLKFKILSLEIFKFYKR
jgi:hypothetical protein